MILVKIVKIANLVELVSLAISSNNIDSSDNIHTLVVIQSGNSEPSETRDPSEK